MSSGKHYKSLCFHLKVFFKGVLRFRLLDHQRTGPTAREPVTFTSHIVYIFIVGDREAALCLLGWILRADESLEFCGQRLVDSFCQ